jgi:hypothetical protein
MGWPDFRARRFCVCRAAVSTRKWMALSQIRTYALLQARCGVGGASRRSEGRPGNLASSRLAAPIFCPDLESAFSDFSLPAQPVDATQALNLSAWVSNFKVSRGRSFTRAFLGLHGCASDLEARCRSFRWGFGRFGNRPNESDH